MIKFIDTVPVGQVTETKEGYLVATSKVARTGVQLYYAYECGDAAKEAGFAPDDIVRVYRHEDQVFADSVLKTITRIPITIGHPDEFVDANNWKDLAKGEVGDRVTRDGDWLVVNPMIKDSEAIQLAKTSHKELSLGYNAKITPARDGVDADFEMVDLQINHLALTPKARAGDSARIGDSWGASPISDAGLEDRVINNGGHKMTFKTVVLGDKAVKVAAEDEALIEAFKDASIKAMEKQAAEYQAAIEAKDEELGKLKAELLAAKDAANVDVDKLVAARTELLSQVAAIDSKINPAGLSDAELKKKAVAAKLGDEAVANASDAEVNGMFKAVCRMQPRRRNAVDSVFGDGIDVATDAATRVNDAFKQSVADLNAWRNQ